MGKHRAVFVDRDGVLNKTYPDNGTTRGPRSVDEVVLLPGVYEACQKLYRNAKPFIVIGVTNQPDVARSLMTFRRAESINALVKRLAWITAIYPCYHDDTANCYCRKPRPGLLLQAAAWNDIDLAKSFMVGDRATDIEAGIRAGCRTVKIGEPCARADHCAASLLDAIPYILENAQ